MSTDEPFRIDVDDDTITLAGDLDAHTAPQLDDAVTELIGRGCSRIVLRMAEVEFVDSSGLRSMIRARNEGATDGDAAREVVIEEPSSATVRLLEITSLTGQFTIRSSS
jgi:anti-anti-sigma factor